MAEPELKSRSSRESVAKAVSQEKMGGEYSFFRGSHMVQSCNMRSLMQHHLMQDDGLGV